MNIAAIEYTLSQSSLDIYVSGCNAPHCKKCHNPELWSFSTGVDYKGEILEKIKTRIFEFPELIHNIFIIGGEPLNQNLGELKEFLIFLRTFKLPIYLFTRYSLHEVPDNILQNLDYIKTGKYDHTKTDNCKNKFGIQLASNNQTITKVS